LKIGIVPPNDIDYGLDLAYALDKAGEHVFLYLPKSDADKALGNNPHAVDTFHDLGILPKSVHIHLYDAPRMRYPRSLAVMRSLSQTMIKDGVDVAFLLAGGGEFWLAVLSFLLRRLPVCSTMIMPKPNIGEPLITSFIIAVNWLLARCSDIIVVNGKNQVSFTQEKYGLPSSKVYYLPLPPRETTVRWARKNVDEEPGLILFLGRVVPHKGIEYLVRAQPLITKYVDYARIVIAGKGPQFEQCRQLIQDPNRILLLEGFIPNEVAADLFHRASVVVLPYLTASTSGILATAQAFGKPVVATRVGALSEYVEDKVTGILVPPANEEKLAAAIVELLKNDELRHQMGKNALSKVAEMRNECVRQTLSVLEKCIACHRMKSN
jgi:glycosyltransferase involved in cell wall biosynthesis